MRQDCSQIHCPLPHATSPLPPPPLTIYLSLCAFYCVKKAKKEVQTLNALLMDEYFFSWWLLHAPHPLFSCPALLPSPLPPRNGSNALAARHKQPRSAASKMQLATNFELDKKQSRTPPRSSRSSSRGRAAAGESIKRQRQTNTKTKGKTQV